MVRYGRRRMGRSRYSRRKSFRSIVKRMRRPMRRRYRRRKSAPLIAPASVVVKHRFVQWVNVDPGDVVGLSFVKTFRANGLFDPDSALGGHQPSGFDFWSQKYDRYVVLGSKITIRPIGNGSNPTINRIDVTSDQIPPQYLNNEAMIAEKGGGVESARFWGNANNSLGSGDCLKAYWSLKKRGDPKDPNMAGTETSVPPAEWFFHWTTMVMANVNPSAFPVFVQIDYITKWFDRVRETDKN